MIFNYSLSPAEQIEANRGKIEEGAGGTPCAIPFVVSFKFYLILKLTELLFNLIIHKVNTEISLGFPV